MAAVLSNQKIINEINAIQDNFIKTRPKMEMNAFKPTRFGEYNLGDERGGRRHTLAARQALSMIHPLAPAAADIFIRKSQGGMMGSGSPAFQKHPLSYGNINGNTLHPDPLYSGVVYQKYKDTKGGALLAKSMPLTGESDSDTDSGSESAEGGDIMSESSEDEYSSDEEGELGGRKKLNKVTNMINRHKMAPVKGGSKMADIAKQAGMAIYKVINTAEAKGLAEGAIKTAIMGVLTAYFGPTGTTIGAVGINEVDKLRKQFGNKNKGSGIADDIKETAASVKKRLKPIGDAIYRAAVSEEAKTLGKVALIGLIVSIIGHKAYQLSKDVGAFGDMVQRFETEEFKPSFGHTLPKPNTTETPEEATARRMAASEARARFWEQHHESERGNPQTTANEVADRFYQMQDDNKKNEESKEDFYSGNNPFTQEYRGPGLKKKQTKRLVGTKRGNRARGDIVAEIMRKKGLSLPHASKYVKDHQLY
jgi:hypothetical protein